MKEVDSTCVNGKSVLHNFWVIHWVFHKSLMIVSRLRRLVSRKKGWSQPSETWIFLCCLRTQQAGLGWQTFSPASYLAIFGRSILQLFAFFCKTPLQETCSEPSDDAGQSVQHHAWSRKPYYKIWIARWTNNETYCLESHHTISPMSSERSGEIFNLEGSSVCAWCISSLESQRKGMPSKSRSMLRRNWCC